MEKIELPFANEIGWVDKEEITIRRFMFKKTVPTSDIKRLGLYKRSSLRKNILIYEISFFILIYYLVKLNTLSELLSISLFLSVIVGFFYAFFGKYYHYTLVVHCRGGINFKYRFNEAQKNELQAFQKAITQVLADLHPDRFPDFVQQTEEVI
jgi:hypothetical protein